MERRRTIFGGTYYYLTPEEVEAVSNDFELKIVVAMRGKLQRDGRIMVRIADTLLFPRDRFVDEAFMGFMREDYGVDTLQVACKTSNIEVLEKVE
jgi:hypothetical protein